MNKKPLVSVCMIAYNHEPYIAQAIEGVLIQETDFEVELILADDSSPDNTEEIVQEYIYDHPKGSLVKYTKHARNLGMIKNLIWALNNCQGKYIALCEGDDYWTDPYKLQKQVDFLEANPNFVLTYHPVDVLFPDCRMEEDFGIKGIIDKTEVNIYDLAALGNFIHTPSVVFRNILKEFPQEFYQSPLGDFFLYMLLAEHGLFKMLNNNMAVYRYGIGIQSKLNKEKKLNNLLKTLNLLMVVIKDDTIRQIIFLRIETCKYNFILENHQNSRVEFLKANSSILEIARIIWGKMKARIS